MKQEKRGEKYDKNMTPGICEIVQCGCFLNVSIKIVIVR